MPPPSEEAWRLRYGKALVKARVIMDRPPNDLLSRKREPFTSSKVHDAKNNERHVCGRRRDGEAAVLVVSYFEL